MPQEMLNPEALSLQQLAPAPQGIMLRPIQIMPVSVDVAAPQGREAGYREYYIRGVPLGASQELVETDADGVAQVLAIPPQTPAMANHLRLQFMAAYLPVELEPGDYIDASSDQNVNLSS